MSDRSIEAVGELCNTEPKKGVSEREIKVVLAGRGQHLRQVTAQAHHVTWLVVIMSNVYMQTFRGSLRHHWYL